MCAKWMAILGFFCGVLYSVGGFFVDLFTIGLNRGTALAFMALVGMPLIFGVVGFLAGLIIALVARCTGSLSNHAGIEYQPDPGLCPVQLYLLHAHNGVAEYAFGPQHACADGPFLVRTISSTGPVFQAETLGFSGVPPLFPRRRRTVCHSRLLQPMNRLLK